MTLATLLRLAAVFLVAIGIGLVSAALCTSSAGTLQAGLISCGFGVGILLALSLQKE